MSSASLETRGSPVQRQLDAYEESAGPAWTEERARRDSAETMAVGISVFNLLQERINSWEERVFRGTQDYSPADDHSFQQQLRDWLQITDRVLRNLAVFEAALRLVSDADHLRACSAQAQQLLASWTPPHLSAAVGLREITLSPEEAAELDRILEEAKHLPPDPPHRKMEEMPASEFQRLVKP